MNQIIAAVMIFGIITVVFAPIIATSGSQIFSKSASISENIESSRDRTGQMMVSTNMHQQDGTVTIHLSNIGIRDIAIHSVLLDGAESRYMLKDQNGAPAGVLARGGMGVLEVNGTAAGAVQIVTDSGKFFEFSVR